MKWIARMALAVSVVVVMQMGLAAHASGWSPGQRGHSGRSPQSQSQHRGAKHGPQMHGHPRGAQHGHHRGHVTRHRAQSWVYRQSFYPRSFYPPSYYRPGGHGYPVYSSPYPLYPVYQVPGVISTYPAAVAPGPQGDPGSYWYYCEDAGAYYPYVNECPAGWLPVIPSTAGD